MIRDQKCRYSFQPLSPIHCRKDGINAGDIAVTDKTLFPIQDILSPILRRGGSDGRSVRACMGFGQSEGCKPWFFSARSQREEGPLLLVGSSHHEGKKRIRSRRESHTPIRHRQFFYHSRHRHKVQATSSIFLWHTHCQETFFGHSLHERPETGLIRSLVQLPS